MTSTRWTAAATAVLAAAAIATGAPAHADAPRIIDLGTLPGGHASVVLGGNDSGLWAGASDDGSGRTHAVYWSGGRIHDLGLQTGEAGDGVGAVSVNARGVIAANVPVSRGSFILRAYLWQAGHKRLLRLPSGATSDWSSTVTRIKDSGVAVGAVGEFPGRNQTVEEHPAIWSRATAAPRLLDFPERYDGGYVEDVNRNGVAVGVVFDDISSAPWEWDANGHGHPLVPSKPDGQGGAYVIDDAGVVAGAGNLGGDLDSQAYVAVTWQNGREHALSSSTDASYLAASNYHGSYTGQAFRSESSPCCAMIYRSGSPFRTLLPLSRHLGDATVSWAVTTNNTVGGSSDIGNGDMHATLWTQAFQQGFVPPASGTAPASTHPMRSLPGPAGAFRP